MKVNDYIKQVQSSAAFHNWSGEGYYLVHIFSMSGHSPQVGYYSPDDDKVVTFNIAEEITMNPPEDSFKESGAISRLDIDKVQVDIDKAREAADSFRQENYPEEKVDREMIILQTLEEEPVYNITLITKSFNFINVKIRATDMSIKDYQKNSILDLKK